MVDFTIKQEIVNKLLKSQETKNKRFVSKVLYIKVEP